MTVENFLRKLHEINAPKERECERERAVQILAELLGAYFGVNPSEAEAFLTELEPSVVQEFASDPERLQQRGYLVAMLFKHRASQEVQRNLARCEPRPCSPVSASR